METLFCIIIIFLISFGPTLFSSFLEIIKKAKNYDKDIAKIKKDYEKRIQDIYSHFKNNIDVLELQKEIVNLKNDSNKRIDLIKNERVKDRLYRFSEIIVNKELELFDNLVVHFENKTRPSYSSSEKVKVAKSVANDFSLKYKQMKYEYDLLFYIFPELEDYLDKYNNEETTLDELQENYDCSKKYLTKEEYDKLNEDERNQLALDRYIENHKKSKWQIGRDYELYIGYNYQKNGYKVQYFGIEQKLEDMGRDIIAEKDKEIHIIQCKYWSKEKTIHEKHICQLYGTAIQYKKKTKTKKKVIPVFITQTKISSTAKDFAKHLKVMIFENYEMGEFPRIKCNIGKKKEKIYHLPFDQQYDNVIIEPEKGEFWATNIKEATNKGFRRAKKWLL